MAVRAGRPSSGSGGIEAYAGLARASLGAAGLLAARISRLLVGEETPLDFANKGKLKGKSKRVTKATPASAQLRSPSKKSTGSPTAGATSSAQEEASPAAILKAMGSASYQESAVAPLAAVNATRRPTQATYLPTLLPTGPPRPGMTASSGPCEREQEAGPPVTRRQRSGAMGRGPRTSQL